MHLQSSIFFLCLLLTFASKAINFEKKNQRLYLFDPSCKEVADIALSLKEWIQNEGIEKNCSLSSKAFIESQGQCELDITDCVPDHVVRYQNSSSEFDGPNCFNLALVMKNILPALRYAHPNEMSFYMRPPLCQELGPEEPLAPGDVGAIRDLSSGGASEAHGFIYISDKISYSKNGSEQNFPYALQRTENMLKGYGVSTNPECRRSRANSSLACTSAVFYYRCSSMEQYLKNHPQIPAQLTKTLNQIDDFEICLQARTVRGETLPGSARQSLIDVSKALVAYLEDQEKRSEINGLKGDERAFILGSLQMRLVSISEQLSSLKEKISAKQVSHLAEAVRGASQRLEEKSK